MQTVQSGDRVCSGAGRRTQRVPGRDRPHGRYSDTKAEYLYIYAGDDPINSVDPLGLSEATEAGGAEEGGALTEYDADRIAAANERLRVENLQRSKWARFRYRLTQARTAFSRCIEGGTDFADKVIPPSGIPEGMGGVRAEWAIRLLACMHQLFGRGG